MRHIFLKLYKVDEIDNIAQLSLKLVYSLNENILYLKLDVIK